MRCNKNYKLLEHIENTFTVVIHSDDFEINYDNNSILWRDISSNRSKSVYIYQQYLQLSQRFAVKYFVSLKNEYVYLLEKRNFILTFHMLLRI